MSELKRVTLRLARNPDAGAPDGDPHRGYTIVAPLDAEGRLDPVLWKQEKARCTVIRFSPNADERADGWLTHRGTHWALHYDDADEGPDESVFKLDAHKLAADEYVTVRHPGGEALVYRVTEVNRLV